MSIESVRSFLEKNAPDIQIVQLDQSTATVDLAASGLGVAPERIAKTLSLRVHDEVFIVVTSGTARLDNRKTKEALGGKAKMLDATEVEEITGHPVGGVCPFGLKPGLRVCCDVSLKAFGEVFPAAGEVNSSIRISPQRLAEITGATWVDICKDAS